MRARRHHARARPARAEARRLRRSGDATRRGTPARSPLITPAGCPPQRWPSRSRGPMLIMFIPAVGRLRSTRPPRMGIMGPSNRAGAPGVGAQEGTSHAQPHRPDGLVFWSSRFSAACFGPSCLARRRSSASGWPRAPSSTCCIATATPCPRRASSSISCARQSTSWAGASSSMPVSMWTRARSSPPSASAASPSRSASKTHSQTSSAACRSRSWAS